MNIIAANLSVGFWMVASVALAGSAHTKAPSPACFEGGLKGKAVPMAKTQEDCQKMGDKFTWIDAHQKKNTTKIKDQAQQAKAVETTPSPALPDAAAVPSPDEAPKK